MLKNKNKKNAVSDSDAQATLASIEIPVTIEANETPAIETPTIETPTIETPVKTENEKLLDETEKAFGIVKARVDTLTTTKEKVKVIKERDKLEIKVLTLKEKVRKEKENGSKVSGNGRYTRSNSIVDTIKSLDYSFKADLKDLIAKSDILFTEKNPGKNNLTMSERYIVKIVPSLILLGFASEKNGIVVVTKPIEADNPIN
jgi:hypothetical protein